MLNIFYYCENLSDVYCYVEAPPFTEFSFEEIDLSKSTLHVPAVSVDKYRNAIEWQDFGKIVALTEDDPNPTRIESSKEDKISYPIGTYTIDGKRLDKPQQGINVVDSKKVIVR